MKKITNHITARHCVKITYFLFLFLLLTGIASHAQPPDLGGDVDAPIDGGLSLLIAAGVGYGAKKLKNRKKSSE